MMVNGKFHSIMLGYLRMMEYLPDPSGNDCYIAIENGHRMRDYGIPSDNPIVCSSEDADITPESASYTFCCLCT